VKRGEIWWADLGPNRPREQTGHRPAVVWQNDASLERVTWRQHRCEANWREVLAAGFHELLISAFSTACGFRSITVK
jgi:hypothetical protein